MAEAAPEGAVQAGRPWVAGMFAGLLLSFCLFVAYFKGHIGAPTVLWPFVLHPVALLSVSFVAAVACVVSSFGAVRRGWSVGAVGKLLGLPLVFCSGVMAPLELLGGWISPSPEPDDPYALLDGGLWRVTTVETGDFVYATRLYRCDSLGLVCRWCTDGAFVADSFHQLHWNGEIIDTAPLCDRVARPSIDVIGAPG